MSTALIVIVALVILFLLAGPIVKLASELGEMLATMLLAALIIGVVVGIPYFLWFNLIAHKEEKLLQPHKDQRIEAPVPPLVERLPVRRPEIDEHPVRAPHPQLDQPTVSAPSSSTKSPPPSIFRPQPQPLSVSYKGSKYLVRSARKLEGQPFVEARTDRGIMVLPAGLIPREFLESQSPAIK